MGWASGTDLMSEIIDAAKEAIPEDWKRKEFYKKVISAFEDMDWDCQGECLREDPAFDDALKKLHPDWDWND